MTPTEGGRELHLTELVAGLRRNLSLFVVSIIGAVGVSGAVALFLQPKFVAEAQVLIEESSPGASLISSMASLPTGLAGLVGGAPQTLAEIEILRSRPVLGDVVRRPDPGAIAPDAGLDLQVRLDDLDQQDLWRVGLRKLRGEAEPAGSLAVEVERWDFPEEFEHGLRLDFHGGGELEVSIDRLLDRRARRVNVEPGVPFDFEQATLVLRPEGDLSDRHFRLGYGTFQKTVEVLSDDLILKEVQRGSSVVQISLSDPDPDRCAATINSLIRSYLAHNRVRRARGAGRGVAFVEEEMERVRGELRQAEEDLAAFAQEAGPMALPESVVALVGVLAELDVERERLSITARAAEDLLAAVESGDLDSQAIAGLELTVLEEGVTLGEAVEPLSVLLAKRASLSAFYESEWPEVKLLDLQIEARQDSVANLLRSQANRDRLLSAGLDTIQERYFEEMADLPQTQVELVRYQRRVEAYTQIFLFLLAQLQQAKIQEATAVPNVDVVEWAEPPRKRESPRLLIVAAIGLVLGVCLGGALAFMRELPRPVTETTQLAALTGSEVVGVLPRLRELRRHPLASRDRADGPAAEAFRSLRAGLRPRLEETRVRSLAVLSTIRREGRSSLAAGLAIALARGGARVLLVDADPTRAGLGAWFGAADEPGLAQLLRGEPEWRDGIRSGGVDGLEVLPVGRAANDLSDHLAGSQAPLRLVELAVDHDLVIFDGPPVEEGSLAVTLGARAGGVLYLARAERVPEARLGNAVDRLRQAGATLLAAVHRDPRRRA